MKKSEFKQLIKESVREVLLTEGFLSTIVSEVVKGIGTNIVTEEVIKKPSRRRKYKGYSVWKKRSHSL